MRRLYFGYGSNLDEPDFLAYVGACGFAGASLRRGVPAFLPDHAPAYRYRSVAREGGALDVRPCLGAVTPGALFEIDDLTARALDDKEGVSSRCYERVDVVALDNHGEEHRAFTYRVCEERLIDFMPPLEGYARVVARGLERFSLPARWHEAAARGEALEPLPIFVYGTLMRGEAAAPRLTHESWQGADEARLRGLLLDLGDYPGLVRGEASVRGELHRFGCLDSVLPRLDEYEDFLGYGREGSLYRRVLAEARVATSSELAWVYRYLGDPSAHAVIASGDWARRSVAV